MAKGFRDIQWEEVYEELADSIKAAKEEQITLIRYNSTTGEAWRISPDGTVEPYEIGPSQTDWTRVSAITDEEIEANSKSDDSVPEDWLKHAEIIPHPKEDTANVKE